MYCYPSSIVLPSFFHLQPLPSICHRSCFIFAVTFNEWSLHRSSIFNIIFINSNNQPLPSTILNRVALSSLHHPQPLPSPSSFLRMPPSRRFFVTMQVQRAAPLDLQCKDKFLVQSTVVPSGTVEEDITSDMFVKDSGKLIDERKLRVILVCLPQSPVIAAVNGVPNQDPSLDVPQNEKILSEFENLPSLHKKPEGFINAKPVEETRLTSDAETILADDENELSIAKSNNSYEVKNMEEMKYPKIEMEDNLTNELEELKSKIDVQGSKLVEAEHSVARLTDEKMKAMQEKEMVKRELALMKRRLGGKTVHMGFPLLYICMVALISLSVGYMMQ